MSHTICTAVDTFSSPENLRDYLNKVSVTPWFDPIVYLDSKVAPAVRKDSSGIFLALVTPHLPVSASTLARWLSAYLTMGGVDNSKSKKHSARAATTAFLKTEKSLFMKEICDLASVSDTYKKFYARARYI